MTTYSWNLIRDQAIQTWGTIPGGQLESDILEVFEQAPALVAATIHKTTDAYQAGRINNPWAILRLELQKAISSERNPTVTDEHERQDAIAKAEAWMKQAGLHYPTEDEALSHLFSVQVFTPPVEYLEHIEATTRDSPGRALYEGLLLANIARTREHGIQQVPTDETGILSRFDSPQLRERMAALYHDVRPLGIKTELEQQERLAEWKRQRDAMPDQPERHGDNRHLALVKSQQPLPSDHHQPAT